uniref:NLR family CARD domain containing 5 n=1 Tax=Leptobrachium leishanense TaxID=445787 RepID=A0A8C5Q5E6_9ANUR
MVLQLEDRVSLVAMDGQNLQDGIENLFPLLVDFFVQNVDWCLAKANASLPGVDLSYISEMPESSKKVSSLLNEFSQSREAWETFIQHVCMEGALPIDLETQLLSVTGEGAERISWEPFLAGEVKGSNRRKLAATERYRAQIVNVLSKKYGFRDKEPNQMFVEPLIQPMKMAMEKKGSKSDDELPSAAEDFTDSVKISQMFKRTSLSDTHAILLVGMPGTGKTLLTHRICYEWANGGFAQFKLTFLFEFRQLNLIKTPFTLKELLFNLFLKPDTDLEDVYDYIIENPQQVLIIFDGLDEFVGQVSQDSLQINMDLGQVVPVSEIFQCILHGKVLSGCTTVVTCRSKILDNNLLNLADSVAEVLGFNEQRVEEYVKSFFHKGPIQDKALFHLRKSHTLLHMCFVPALCHIVCICLEHMLHVSSLNLQLPQTITQFYLKMLNIFIWKRQKSSTSDGVVLKKFSPVICELCHLALKGLDENKTVFYVEEISDDLKGFAPRHGLLSTFDVKKMDSGTDPGFSFVHLSSQEFFASLYLMISKSVTQTSLNKKLSLKSKWNIKFKTKEEFTDNFHIFLSGLSSMECRSFLCELAEHSEVLIQKKQETIIKCLVKLAKTPLTGPKLIELCHCIYETQDLNLAQSIGGQLKKYEFKNFRINPVDMIALSFVVNQGKSLACLDFGGCAMESECLVVLEKCENVQSVSFRNRKYGDVFVQALAKCLPGMKSLKTLKLTTGRITDAGIAALTQAFLLCQQIEEISLPDNHLKTKNMLALLELFPKMELLKQMDLSNNENNVKSTLALTKAASKVQKITHVNLSVGSSTAVFISDHTLPTNSPQLKKKRRDKAAGNIKKALSLESCHLTPDHTPQLISILTDCANLSDVNLSDNALGDIGCKALINALPKIHISGKLSLDKTQLSEEGILCLIGSMISCPNVKQVEIQGQKHEAAISFLMDKEDEHQGIRSIRINNCRVPQKLTEKLCALFKQCHNLTDLDLADNHLENASVQQITQILPELQDLRSVNLSGNRISTCGIISLSKCLSAVTNMTDLAIGFSVHQKVSVKFQRNTRENPFHMSEEDITDLPRPKIFSLTGSRITSHKLQKIFLALVQCTELTEINLSDNALSYQNIENMVKYLPRFPNLTFVNFSNSDLSADCALLLANSVSLCDRIKEVDVRSAEHMCFHLERQQSAKEVVIRLNNCNIGKSDVDLLAKAFHCILNLTEVSLCMNKLMEDGVLSLLSALSSNRCATAFDVCLHPRETVRISFSPNGDSLRKIRLAAYNFQAEHHKRLLSLLGEFDNLTHFTSMGNSKFMEAFPSYLSMLSRKPNAFTISIHEPSVGLDQVIDLIRENPPIIPSVKAIRAYKGKIILELHGQNACPSTRFSNGGLETKSSFPNTLLADCAGLIELNLSHTMLDDAGIQVLSKVLPSLRSLKKLEIERVNLSYAGASQIIEALSCCRTIQNINFSFTELGSAGALSFAKLLEEKQNFHSIKVSHCFSIASEEGRRFLLELLKCTELQELYLESMHLNDPSLQILSQGLLKLPSLKKLMLGENNITYQGLYYLTEHISTCTNMEAIDLSRNVIGCEGVERLSAVLPNLRNLRKIRLSRTNFSPSGEVRFAEALQQCALLEELDLRSCSLGDNHECAVVQALVSCQQIEDISLAENKLRQSCLLKLANGLQHFHLLKKIDLKLCEISDNVCSSLTRGFACCRNLEEVILSWNAIGNEGACALASAFKTMRSLKKLDLEKNKIQVEGAEAIARELSICLWIKVIRLWSNLIPKNTEEELNGQDSRLNFSFF